ncbi:MAG TPA: hypothetical protein VLF94_06245 [Chlamydiales bacterium]|nr:hypothetical protein [Chlamydiales bacterium]
MNQWIPKFFMGLLPFAAIHGADMKLVHAPTGYVVVEFKQDGQIIFNDRYLKAEMEEQGILIPPAMRAKFDNKKTVFLDDPLFPRAFVEVYCPLCIADPAFTWK